LLAGQLVHQSRIIGLLDNWITATEHQITRVSDGEGQISENQKNFI